MRDCRGNAYPLPVPSKRVEVHQRLATTDLQISSDLWKDFKFSVLWVPFVSTDSTSDFWYLNGLFVAACASLLATRGNNKQNWIIKKHIFPSLKVVKTSLEWRWSQASGQLELAFLLGFQVPLTKQHYSHDNKGRSFFQGNLLYKHVLFSGSELPCSVCNGMLKLFGDARYFF